jgi:hypothetical protein
MKWGDNPTYAPPQHQYQYHHDALLPNLCLCSSGFLDHPASPFSMPSGSYFFPTAIPSLGVLHGYVTVLVMVQACHMFIEYVLNQK